MLTFTATAMLVAGIVVSGCRPVDRWAVFEDVAVGDAVPDDPHGAALDPEPIEHADEPDEPTIPDVDEPWELSVEQAVMLALRRNRDLAVQQYGPVIAGTFQDIERGRFDPTLFADLEHSQRRASQLIAAEEFRVIRDETQQATVGVAQELPTGTRVEPTFNVRRNEPTVGDAQYSTRVGITATQALLEGRSINANLAGIRQARLGHRASQYELRGFAEALLAETESVYWLYVLAVQRLAVFEQSLAVAEQQRDEVAIRIEVGDLPETERPAVEAEVAQRRQDLIDARSELEDRRLTLLRLINPDHASAFDRDIEPQLVDDLPALEVVEVRDRVELARRYRPDLNEARIRHEQNRLETVVTRDGTLPRLDLFVSLGKTGFARQFRGAFEELDGDTYDLTVGANFSYALGNRTARARDRAAFAERRQAAAAVDNMTQLDELDVRRALNEVDRTFQQIDASRATRALREETVRAEEERFRVGESTAFQVAQAQRDLLDSQIGELEAQLQYRLAVIELYLNEGTLLDRRGFTLPR